MADKRPRSLVNLSIGPEIRLGPSGLSISSSEAEPVVDLVSYLTPSYPTPWYRKLWLRLLDWSALIDQTRHKIIEFIKEKYSQWQ